MTARTLDINSSALNGATYDSEKRELVLDWLGGAYAYSGVPEEVADELENAGSQGRYANMIKHEYSFRRV